MKIHYKLVPFALLLFAPGLIAGPSNPAEVRSILQAAGYQGVHDIERDDGLWEADVIRSDGSYGDVLVDPRSGEVFDVRSGRVVIGADVIVRMLTDAGHRDIRELKREGAVWNAVAIDGNGRRMELRMSGYDGRVLYSERDYELFD